MRPIRADSGWLLVIVAIALALRIGVPWSLVFTPTHINLLETDAWYHLRVIENLVAQFPHRLQIDPYALTEPMFLKVPPLFDWLVAGLALIVGGGHPSEALVKTVTVFVPPVLGALTIVMVYAVARKASGGLAGLLAAGMAAILPGHFLDRTLLGYADHHALESLVSMVLLYLLARALTQTSSVVRAGLALGVALIVFRLTWTSAAMFVGVLIVWLVVHTTLQAWRRGDTGDVARVVGIAAVTAVVFTLAFRGLEPFGVHLQVAALSVLAVVAAAVEIGRHGLRVGWWSSRRLALLATGGAAVAVALSVIVFPATVGAVFSELSRFRLSESSTSVIEARPLFLYDGTWSLRPAWTLFRSGFLLGVAAVMFLAVRWWKRKEPMDLLLIVWTLAMFAATIGVNRFGYYLVPAIAVVSGCACAAVLKAGRRAGAWWSRTAAVVVTVVAFGVNIEPAIATAGRPAGISSEWFPAFEWLRQQSDEPFGDPAHYYARYDEGTIRPASSTVMLWWDYGYGLMAAARRVPVAIPTGSGAVPAAQFFTEVDETRALAVLDATRARHVLMDDLLPFSVATDGSPYGKFEALTGWAGLPTTRFYDVFAVRVGNQYDAVILYFEDYYRSMTFRLGVLGGQGAMPTGPTTVVSWTIEHIPGVGPIRIMSLLEAHPSYDAAVRRLQDLGPGNHAIVGRDPRVSAIPLDPLRGLRRVFATPAPGAFGQGAVQVFERAR